MKQATEILWLPPETLRGKALWYPKPGADAAAQDAPPAQEHVCSVLPLRPRLAPRQEAPQTVTERSLFIAAPRTERVSIVSEGLGARGYRFEHAAPTSREELSCALQRFEGRVFVLHVALLDDIGLSELLQLKRQFPALDFVLAWQRPWPMWADLVVRFEARGCIDFDDDLTIARAIDNVVRGELWFPRWVTDSLYVAFMSAQRRGRIDAATTLDSEGTSLTHREDEVFALMRQGLTNKQIARRLSISENTIKKHLKNVFEKRGLHSRRQALG